MDDMCGDPIQLAWMVKELAGFGSGENLIHHPGELDGACSGRRQRLLARHLLHRSAQGGWGRIEAIVVKERLDGSAAQDAHTRHTAVRQDALRWRLFYGHSNCLDLPGLVSFSLS